MNNTFISPFQAPSLSELLSQQLRKIDSLVNNLKPKDVLEEEAFESTVSRIKAQILPTPVEVGEPKHIDYVYHERQLSFQQQMFHPTGNGNFYRHEVKFPFTGTGELFYHTSNGFSFSSSDHGMIRPSGNSLTVFVDIQTVDPKVAIAEARKILHLTLLLANEAMLNLQFGHLVSKIELNISLQKNEKNLRNSLANH